NRRPGGRGAAGGVRWAGLLPELGEPLGPDQPGLPGQHPGPRALLGAGARRLHRYPHRRLPLLHPRVRPAPAPVALPALPTLLRRGAARVVVPPLFRDDPEARAILDEVYEVTLDAYRRLVALGNRRLEGLTDRTLRRKRAREAARAVLPNMTETHIVMSGNHRSWREF